MTPALKRYVAEFIGTFILVAIGPGAAMVSSSTHAFGHTGIALAFGLAVTLCDYPYRFAAAPLADRRSVPLRRCAPR